MGVCELTQKWVDSAFFQEGYFPNFLKKATFVTYISWFTMSFQYSINCFELSASNFFQKMTKHQILIKRCSRSPSPREFVDSRWSDMNLNQTLVIFNICKALWITIVLRFLLSLPWGFKHALWFLAKCWDCLMGCFVWFECFNPNFTICDFLLGQFLFVPDPYKDVPALDWCR